MIFQHLSYRALCGVLSSPFLSVNHMFNQILSQRKVEKPEIALGTMRKAVLVGFVGIFFYLTDSN